MATLKGLPSAYDKDLQEDKEPVFDAYDTLASLLPVLAGMLRSLRLHPERMAARLEPGLLATDMADYLVRKGIPFREAHALVGRAVRLAEDRELALPDLPLEDLQAISQRFEADVKEVFDVEAALSRRAATGGTAPKALRAQLEAARAALGRDIRIT
jgi:argininosuccinate lyase